MRELTPRAKLMSDCFLQFQACSPMPCVRSVQSPQPYPTFCDPMNCSTPVFPVHHQLWSFKSHVHWAGDAIQPSHPLLSPSLPPFNLSQHQGLFQGVSSLHQVAKVLELQHQSFQCIQDWFSLGLTGWISLQSMGLSRVFSNITIQKHQFFSAILCGPTLMVSKEH